VFQQVTNEEIGCFQIKNYSVTIPGLVGQVDVNIEMATLYEHLILVGLE